MHSARVQAKARGPAATTAGSGGATAAPQAMPSRLPAWTRGWGDRPPTSLVMPRAGMQAKREIGPPGHSGEQEAARVAEPVARLPESRTHVQRKCACGGLAGPDGECAACRARRVALRRAAAGPAAAAAPPIVHDVLRSPGRPLDAATRAFMEPRFGHDFSRVRVHTDARAAESARAVDALAYTVGHNVVFGAGQYAPGTATGRRLLAHELAHVAQQGAGGLPEAAPGTPGLAVAGHDALEAEANRAEGALDRPGTPIRAGAASPTPFPLVRRRVNPANVSCRGTGLRNPDLTGDEAVAAIEAADAEAITLALRAELLLDVHLLLTRAGEPVDPEFDTILQEELGLTLTNPAHHRLIAQQRDRFRRVRETLESGYLRYICRGDSVSLVGCTPGSCGENFAFSCPGNRLVVLCQAFWDEPAEQAATILHEPFHIWFDMARHDPSALRRADASCFESFAIRLAGGTPPASCADHTWG